jgi:hypothetical protein
MTARRIHQAEDRVPYWRGNLGEVVRLVILLRDAVFDRAVGDDPHLAFKVTVYYAGDGGTHYFEAVNELANEVSKLHPGDIDAIMVEATYFFEGGHDTAELNFFSSTGVNLKAASHDPVWTKGIVDYLLVEVRKGETPEYRPEMEPFTTEMWVTAIGIALFAGGLAVAAILVDLPLLGWVLVYGFLAAMSWSIWGLTTLLDDRRIRYPHLDLVPAGAPRPLPPPAPGWPEKVQAAVRKRPLVSLFLTFMLGIAVNKVSDLI